MRIACIYLPSLPLQAHVRQRPSLAGSAFAIVTSKGSGKAPKVIACSRAAFAEGVRTGMSVAQVHGTSRHIDMLPFDPELYQSTLEAVAEALMSFSITVDVPVATDSSQTKDSPQAKHAVHRSIYLHVPNGVRGEAFGNKLLNVVHRQGLTGRIGIADDRFAAWAAAATATRGQAHDQSNIPVTVESCTTIPRGGTAVFLAPLPVSWLPIESDIVEVLQALGVNTIGQVATLPPPSMGRRWTDTQADFQQLARGDGPTKLQPFSPAGRIVERMELRRPVTKLEPLSFVLRPVCDRLCARLAGRGTGAAHIVLQLLDHDENPVAELNVEIAEPTAAPSTLLKLVRDQLLRSDETLEATALIAALELVVTQEGDPPTEAELNLFGTAHRLRTPKQDGLVSDFAALDRGAHWRTRRGKHRRRVRRPAMQSHKQPR